MPTWTDRINEMLSSLEAIGSNPAAAAGSPPPNRFLRGSQPAGPGQPAKAPESAPAEGSDIRVTVPVQENPPQDTARALALHDLNAHQLIQGVILSEVLGKPLALRKGHRHY